MATIIFIAVIYGICKLISASSAKRKEERRKAEIARIKREQAEQKAMLKRQQEEAREEARRIAALAREQERQRKEQERLAKEQERQAAQLAKHEERIAKMEFALEKANYDIAFLKERVENLKGCIEDTDRIRREAKPGSKQEQAAINRIMALQNQLHTANVKLGKARFDKERAEKFLQEDVA